MDVRAGSVISKYVAGRPLLSPGVAYVACRRSGSALERADGPSRPPRGGSPWDGFSLY